MITAAERAELRRLSDAAPGVWEVEDLEPHGHVGVLWLKCQRTDDDGVLHYVIVECEDARPMHRADLALAAAARNALPALLDRIDELEAAAQVKAP